MVYALVSLARIGYLTLTSYDSKALTKGVVLQSFLSIVRCVKRLVFARRKKVGGWDLIDRPLDVRNEVFFEVGIRYPYSDYGRSSGAGRAAGGDGEVCEEGGVWVYNGIYGGIYGVEWGVDVGLDLVDLVWKFSI